MKVDINREIDSVLDDTAATVVSGSGLPMAPAGWRRDQAVVTSIAAAVAVVAGACTNTSTVLASPTRSRRT